jgi:hypothetical protein
MFPLNSIIDPRNFGIINVKQEQEIEVQFYNFNLRNEYSQGRRQSLFQCIGFISEDSQLIKGSAYCAIDRCQITLSIAWAVRLLVATQANSKFNRSPFYGNMV